MQSKITEGRQGALFRCYSVSGLARASMHKNSPSLKSC